MCAVDNVITARSFALQCGIFTPGGIIMEGHVFRDLNEREIFEVLPRLQVLARTSPSDKQLLVEERKDLGEVVGVTGDGTNDGPALKSADVGLSMGISDSEVAKEASDIAFQLYGTLQCWVRHERDFLCRSFESPRPRQGNSGRDTLTSRSICFPSIDSRLQRRSHRLQCRW